MTKPTNLASLDQRRRAQRVLQFFADLLGGGSPQDVAGLTTPLSDVKHLPPLDMDIAVTRDAAPANMKAILSYVRRRQVGFILVRFRDQRQTWSRLSSPSRFSTRIWPFRMS